MPARPRICIVSASGQNIFFAEILEALGAGLREHGVTVEESVDHFPPVADDLVYLFVPHEYHPLVNDLAHPTSAHLRRSVALCTEQPGTPWFETGAAIAARAGAVLDINVLGAQELSRRGVKAEYLTLGYVPSWDAWHGEDRDRSIAMTFLGAHTERRAKVLARCAIPLRGRRSAIHLVESVAPHADDARSFISRERKWSLLADSEVLLNVHQSPLPYMEWHRVLGAAINGCVVLSEHSVGFEPLVPGEHFVSVGYEEVHHVIHGLLDDRDRLQRIRHAAYNLVREEMPLDSAIELLLKAAERAGRRRVKAATGPTAGPMPKPHPPRQPGWEADAEIIGEELPIRTALKQLLVQTRRLERQVTDLQLGSDAPDDFTVERFGPRIDDPRVSVLLTVYNYADYVRDALLSVALSDTREIEVVAVDDASSDHSADAVRAACAQLPWLSVRLVRRARNHGLAAARNLAADQAGADLLFILDADNMVLPSGIRTLADALDAAPDAAFAYGLIQTFGAYGPLGVTSWLDWDPERLRYGNYIDAMAMIRKPALQEVGGYSTEGAFSMGWEDFALWVAMADRGMEGVRVPDFVARYRVNPHSMLSLTDIDSSAVWAALLRKYPSLAHPRKPETVEQAA